MPQDPQINPWILSAEAYPAGKTFEEVAAQYGLKQSEILRLAGNETTLGPSPRAIKAANKELERSNYYGEPFSESLTRKLETKFNIDTTKAGIVVGNGMDSVLDHLANLLLNPKSSIINLSPTFAYYKSIAERTGTQIIEVSRNLPESSAGAAYSVDPERIIAAIQANTKIVFICTPNNPTGNSFSRSEIEYLAAETLKRNVYLFVDEAYIDFSRHASVIDLVKQYSNLIVGRTFSKAYALAGFRVGYALLSAELKREYSKIMVPFLCSRASIAAAEAALEDTEHLKRVVDTVNKGREQLYKEFIKLKIEHYPSDGNFILFKTVKPASEIIEGLAQHGVIIRAQKSVCPRALRVTIGTEKENKRFIKALTDII